MTFASNPAEEGYAMQVLRHHSSPKAPGLVAVPKPENTMRDLSSRKRLLNKILAGACYSGAIACAVAAVVRFATLPH